jgi:hypothetical protein
MLDHLDVGKGRTSKRRPLAPMRRYLRAIANENN